MQTNVLIVSCGLASRLSHISDKLTKCLMPINGESALLKQVRYWQNYSQLGCIYVISNKPSQVKRFLHANELQQKVISLEHFEADGSARAIQSAIEQAPELLDSPIIIQWADLVLVKQLNFDTDCNTCIAQQGYGRYIVNDGKIEQCDPDSGNVSGIFHMPKLDRAIAMKHLLIEDFAGQADKFNDLNWRELELADDELIQFGDAKQMAKAETMCEPIGSIKRTSLVMHESVIVKESAAQEANWYTYWQDGITMPDYSIYEATLVMQRYAAVPKTNATALELCNIIYKTFVQCKLVDIDRYVSKRIYGRLGNRGTLTKLQNSQLDEYVEQISKRMPNWQPHGVIHGDLTFANAVADYTLILPIDPSNTNCDLMPLGYDLGKVLYGYYTWPICQANAEKLQLPDDIKPAKLLLEDETTRLWCASHLLAAMLMFKQDARRTEWLVEENLRLAKELIYYA